MKVCLYEEEMKVQEYVYFTLGAERVQWVPRNTHNKIWDYYVPGKIVVMDFSNDGSYNWSDLRYRNADNEPKVVLPQDTESLDRINEIFGDEICFHFHNHIEINQVVTGKMVYIADGKFLELNPGDMLVVQNRVPHAWRAITDDTFVRHINISVEGFIQKSELFRDEQKLCTNLANGKSVLKIDGSDETHHLMLNAFENAISEQMRKEIGYRGIVRSETTKFVFQLGRYVYNFVDHSGDGKYKESSGVIKQVLDYINDNLSDEITLANAAEIAHMNRTYFSVYFKQEMGMGFNDFITKTRMAKAADLLLNTDSKITNIVSDCGYSSIAHFNKVFKSIYFTTPSHFRASGKK